MSEERFWRTMVRIVEVRMDRVRVVVPGWDPDAAIDLTLDKLPGEFTGRVLPFRAGARWHAEVNIGVRRMSELVFRAWEPPSTVTS